MNKNSFENSGFARLYTWAAKAKFTTGIFFMLHVILYFLFGLIIRGTAATLDFFTALGMLLSCFLIGLLQQAVIPQGKLTRARCSVWVGSGALFTVLFGLAFAWFESFPAWCFPVFIAFVVLAMLLMIVSYYLELLSETRYLNRKLEQFRDNKPQKEA